MVDPEKAYSLLWSQVGPSIAEMQMTVSSYSTAYAGADEDDAASDFIPIPALETPTLM